MTRMILLVLALLVIPGIARAQPTVGGLGWGVGMGFSWNVFGRTIIDPDGAFIDADGIVRVTHPRTVRSRFLTEAHFTFRMTESIALGPVMFLQPSEDDLFDAAGGGLLIEFGSGARSMNIILGVLVDFDVLQLHPSYVDGFPAPTNEILLVSREQIQLLLGFVVGF